MSEVQSSQSAYITMLTDRCNKKANIILDFIERGPVFRKGKVLLELHRLPGRTRPEDCTVLVP